MNDLTNAIPTNPDPEVARMIPFRYAKKRGVLASRREGGVVEVWLREDTHDPMVVAEARRVLRGPIRLRRIPGDEFSKALERTYSNGAPGAYDEVIESIERDGILSRMAEDLPATRDLLESGGEAPVIRLVNDLLAHALKEKASDVHIEPYETRSVIRVRVDGVMSDILELKPMVHTSVVSRIKIMANLDIDVKRMPQDGRVSIRLAGQPVDVRISTLPAAHGERVVLRLLDKQGSVLDLDGIGMSPPMSSKLDALIRQPHGILLVTGPTGSGKTTTLYAAMKRMDLGSRNIMTVEDPIEYNLEGISQTQVNPSIGLTFAKSLRSILRQDPDVIMIGEIRDLDTARIAAQASLTGHLVLATLHTNDSVSAVTRLVDLGVEPYLIASTLIGSLAQRLVRRLCGKCMERRELSPEEKKGMRIRDDVVYRSTGCEECNNIGYKGRAGIFELMTVDDQVRKLIHDGAAEGRIREHAVGKQGMTLLMRDGMRLVGAGITSYEEVMRALES